MKRIKFVSLTVGVLALTAASLALARAQQPMPDKIVVPLFGTTSVSETSGTIGENLLAPTEIQKPKKLGESPLRLGPPGVEFGRTAAGMGTATSSGKKAKSNPNLLFGFEGVNHRDQRLADNGNQFNVEPADQGLCVGNGYLMETVNRALRIYDAVSGAPLTPVLSLNEFYGFPPLIDRGTGVYGPNIYDISCHYDPHSNRWFHLAVDLDQKPDTGEAFTGKNYLDLAVSASGDPTGDWYVYRIPGINDGTEGTPDHNCAGGPCVGDFPRIGVDKHGVYITTNEFPFFADGFTGAQVYAISKSALIAGSPSIDAYLFDTSQPALRVAPDQPGYTLWPALSAGKQFVASQGGTEYFVSSNAVFDDLNADSEEIIVWALSNTKSLETENPSLSLKHVIVPSQRYAVPASSVQKQGPYPLGECLNDTSGAVSGINCGEALVGLPPQNVSVGKIHTSDSRVLGVRHANGKLWAVLGTAVQVEGESRTGVAWYILSPTVTSNGVQAKVRKQGILALAGESLAYPTVGVTTSGRGILGFTRVGEDLYPSQGYASIDDVAGVGPVHMAAEGQSTQDGYTEYPPHGGYRPRWGEYGAAAVDGRVVYLAGQYIAQPECTLAEFIATSFTCFGYRVAVANWSTWVSALKP